MDKVYLRRQKRVRSTLRRNSSRARLSVFRSNKYIYVQIVDDKRNETLISASDVKKSAKGKNVKRVDSAGVVGEDVAKRALKKGIKEVVFDRGGYKYHGRVKALAEGARKGGLSF